MKIHTSGLKSFLGCERYFWFSDPSQLGLQTNKVQDKFYIGTLIHFVLEGYYTGRFRTIKESWQVSKEIYHQMLGDRNHPSREDDDLLVLEILENYIRWIESPIMQANEWGDNNLEYVSMEIPFQIPISGHIFGGRADGLIRRKDTGDLYLLEIKTSAYPPGLIASLHRELQNKAYIWAFRSLGYDIKGMMYNILSKKTSPVPTILNSGKLSKSKSQKTSYETYLKFIELSHPEWTKEQIRQEYQEILIHLLHNNAYFIRHVVEPTQAELENFEELLVDTLPRIENSKFLATGEAIWKMCQYCDFQSPCLEMQTDNFDEAQRQLAGWYSERQDRINRQGQFGPFTVYSTSQKVAVFHNTTLVSAFSDPESAFEKVVIYSNASNLLFTPKEETWNSLMSTN